MTQNGKKNRAMTLTELLVVMAVIVVLLAAAAPVARKLSQSLGNTGGAYSIINAALTSARSIAVREQSYAGVRFQQDYAGRQYLVFIIHDPDDSPDGTGHANGFRAVEGRKAVPLPEGLGVIAGGDYANIDLDTTAEMNDVTTFSIVFNASGKFVIHKVWAYSADGKQTGSTDKIFNAKTLVLDGVDTSRIALLRRDGNDETTNEDNTDGYQQENSVSSFMVYERSKLDKVASNKRWDGYLSGLSKEYVNPYTGELVRRN